MEFVNSLHCGIIDSYYVNFVQDLLNLCKEILETEGEVHQWTAFVRFKRQFLSNYKSRIIAEPYTICSMLLRRIEKLKYGGLKISKLLVDLMTLIYFQYCGKVNCYLVEDIANSPFLTDVETIRTLSAFRTKSGFMDLLLNFGYLSSLHAESPHLEDETRRLIVHFIWSFTRPDDTYSVFEEVVELLKKHFFRSIEKDFHKRVFLVSCALHAIKESLKKEYVVAERLISCLRMYFRATHDPFLSIFEVRSVLYACFTLLKKLDFFEKYSEEFDKLMPGCPAKMEPRNLTHLARCQVRQNLKASNLPLPAAVDKLGLPKILKSFVLCDVVKISRKNENASSQNAVTTAELAGFLSERPML